MSNTHSDMSGTHSDMSNTHSDMINTHSDMSTYTRIWVTHTRIWVVHTQSCSPLPWVLLHIVPTRGDEAWGTSCCGQIRLSPLISPNLLQRARRRQTPFEKSQIISHVLGGQSVYGTYLPCWKSRWIVLSNQGIFEACLKFLAHGARLNELPSSGFLYNGVQYTPILKQKLFLALQKV